MMTKIRAVEKIKADDTQLPRALSRRVKIILSILVTLQLLAVTAEPFRFFTRDASGVPSPVSRPIRSLLAPYVEFAYLNHGYFFFAPEPGPSHLMECRLKTSEGEEKQLRLPDRTAQWPRLLYHRHFMLAEFLHALYAPPVSESPQFRSNQGLMRVWLADRQRFERIRDSMCNHLVARYGVETATIDRLEHQLLNGQQVLAERVQLTDSRLYLLLADEPLDVDASEEDVRKLSNSNEPQSIEPVAKERIQQPIKKVER